jgi:hypothetical protein
MVIAGFIIALGGRVATKKYYVIRGNVTWYQGKFPCISTGPWGTMGFRTSLGFVEIHFNTKSAGPGA